MPGLTNSVAAVLSRYRPRDAGTPGCGNGCRVGGHMHETLSRMYELLAH